MAPEHSIRSKYTQRSRESLIDELIALQSRLSNMPATASEDAPESRWSALESIDDGCFACDGEWRFVYVNRMAEKLLDIRRGEVLGKSYWEVFPSMLGTQLENEYRSAAAGEVRYFDHFCEPWGRWFHNRCSPREAGGLSVHFQDISTRKQVEESLKNREAFLDTLINAIPIPVFYKDREGRYTGFNQAFETFFGVSRDRLIGKTVFDLNPPELAAIYHAKDNELFEDNGVQQYESRIKTEHGKLREVQFNKSVYTDSNGKTIGLIGTILDLTERKQAEAIQRQGELRFRKVFENAGMGIVIQDWEGRFQQCNPAYCRLMGYTEEELCQITFDALIHPEDRDTNMAMIDRLKSGKLGFFEIENRYVHKKGHPVWVRKFVSIIPDEMGQPTHLMALVDDITRSKRTKALLIELNRKLTERKQLAEQRAVEIKRLALELSTAEDRERKRLALVLHDDFQQTLAYIKLKLASLHMDPGAATNLNSVFTIIDGCIQNCRNLANELSPRLIEQKGFFGALRWLCLQMKEMHGLDVDLQTTQEAEIAPIELASTLIRCIRELLFNVVKHSGETHASVQVGMDGKMLTISVEDDGNGCDYDLFGQKQLKGSVFGLLNIEDRIKLLGGQMQVKSQPGKGFHVKIQVPYDIPDQLKEKAIRVLLADDHEVMRVGLAKLIKEEADMEVVGIAANGKEAVDLAKRIAPDVIILDVSMPVMNGIDAARQIKARLPETAIIGLSMHADTEIQQAMLDAGSVACLNKADSASKLVETVRSLPLSGL